MTIRDEEKLVENLNGIIDGLGRVVNGVGQIFGRRDQPSPRKEEDNDMGRRNSDDDDLDDIPLHEKGASLKTRIDDDGIVIAIVVGEKAVKQIRLSEDEAEAHVREVQKRLKGLRAQKDE